MIDSYLELADKWDVTAGTSGASEVTVGADQFDFSAAAHNLGLSSLRFRVQITGDSLAAGFGTKAKFRLQDAPDSGSGSPGSYNYILDTLEHAAADLVPGFIIMDVGLPLDLQRWVRLRMDPLANVTNQVYINAYIYTLK